MNVDQSVRILEQALQQLHNANKKAEDDSTESRHVKQISHSKGRRTSDSPPPITELSFLWTEQCYVCKQRWHEGVYVRITKIPSGKIIVRVRESCGVLRSCLKWGVQIFIPHLLFPLLFIIVFGLFLYFIFGLISEEHASEDKAVAPVAKERVLKFSLVTFAEKENFSLVTLPWKKGSIKENE